MSAICVEDASLAETGQYASLEETSLCPLYAEIGQSALLVETDQYPSPAETVSILCQWRPFNVNGRP